MIGMYIYITHKLYVMKYMVFLLLQFHTIFHWIVMLTLQTPVSKILVQTFWSWSYLHYFDFNFWGGFSAGENTEHDILPICWKLMKIDESSETPNLGPANFGPKQSRTSKIPGSSPTDGF